MLSEPTKQIESLIQKISSEVKIDPDLVRAIIKRESDFRPYVSRKEPKIGDESIGLMQVLVKTARWILRDNELKREDLFDPKINILAGAKYLKYQLDRYRGDIKKAIAAYNAGSARYKRSTNEFINQPYVDFVYDWYLKYKNRKKGTIVGLGMLFLLPIFLYYFRHQL